VSARHQPPRRKLGEGGFVLSKPKRDLSAIEADICATLKRGTADIIKVGELLCEAKANKAQIPHGEWVKWLSGKFSLSERSAQKYMRAYKWSRKTAPDFRFE
jgi:hypothetical protein